MQQLLRIFRHFFRRRSASAPVVSGSGFPTTHSTASTDAQRRREKERLMGGIL
jgi:hypothetical protein